MLLSVLMLLRFNALKYSIFQKCFKFPCLLTLIFVGKQIYLLFISLFQVRPLTMKFVQDTSFLKYLCSRLNHWENKVFERQILPTFPF